MESYIDMRDWPLVMEKPTNPLFRMERPNVKREKRETRKALRKEWKDGAYLQLEWEDGRLSFSASSDARNWKTLGEMLIDSRKKFKVGVAAYSTSFEPFTVQFDQPKIAWIKKKEPLFGPSIRKACFPSPAFPKENQWPATATHEIAQDFSPSLFASTVRSLSRGP